MLFEKNIDDLIEAGRHVLQSDFDSYAFQTWRECAFDCLATFLGPDHAYTLNFKEYVRQGRDADILAGAGILTAAREEMCKPSHRKFVATDGEPTMSKLGNYPARALSGKDRPSPGKAGDNSGR